jgi:uncharacterized protein (DUF1501 family)
MDRRKFIKIAGCTGMSSMTFLNSAVNLRAMGFAAIDNSALSEDYKALVCIQMNGGNDGYNMIVPMDNQEYNDYRTTRSNMALNKDQLIEFNPENSGGRKFGFHHAMPEVEDLFVSGKAAVINNVGTLVTRLTKQQYQSGGARLPLELYSHNDQTRQWQTGICTSRTPIGWGGKIADLVHDMNGNQKVSMAISVESDGAYIQGEKTTPFSIGSGGPGIFWPLNGTNENNPERRAIMSMLDKKYDDAFKDTYKDIIISSHENSVAFRNAYENRIPVSVPFPDNRLSNNLRAVANMIAARKQLQAKRQIYFVSFGNFDYHNELFQSHYRDLREFSQAVSSFMQALEEMGLSENVTTFTISDFARTLTSNGNGTDHAWGSPVMAFGGAVRGNRFYGEYPSLKLGGKDEVGGGVVLPTISTDEYFAELALWFGVSPSELSTIFPGLPNFYSYSSSQKPLGFLKY